MKNPSLLDTLKKSISDGNPNRAYYRGVNLLDNCAHLSKAKVDGSSYDNKYGGIGVPSDSCDGEPDSIIRGTGLKYDAEKQRMDLLDPEFLESVSWVLSFGAKKYAAHNWRGGISFSRLLAASLRHLCAIMRGEDLDPESGLPHTAHIGCCIMFLHWMQLHRPDQDDRYKQPSTLIQNGVKDA